MQKKKKRIQVNFKHNKKAEGPMAQLITLIQKFSNMTSPDFVSGVEPGQTIPTYMC